MAKTVWKGGTILAPIPPVMVSCGTLLEPNILTIAWTGIINSDPPMTYISVRKERFSHHIIEQNREYVINLPSISMAKACDFCGVKSGRFVNKFKECGLTATSSSIISAPQVLEAPVSLECKVLTINSYGTHDMFISEIVAVNVEDKYIDERGRFCLEKAGLIAYVHGGYYTLGRYLGKFGFSVEKKRKKRK